MQKWSKYRWCYQVVLFVLCSGICFLFTSCFQSNPSDIKEGKINVVTSFYPLAFMVEQIGGKYVHTINFIPVGVEPHAWTPKSQNLYQASHAELLVVNGTGFETWFDNFHKGMDKNSKVKIIEASRGIPLLTLEGHESTHKSNGQGNYQLDPHTWVSPKSAFVMAKNIKNALVQVDRQHQAEYEVNYKQLTDKLTAIDNLYMQTLQATKQREIVVSHHAFGYLCRDYHLQQHAIMGITPDAEPQAQDLVKISKIIKEKKIKYVFFEQLVSDQLAKTLANEVGVHTLVLHSLEGLTKQQAEAGDHYLTLMERNLQTLLLALQ